MANEVRVDVKLDTDKAESKLKALKGAFIDIGKIATGINLANLQSEAAEKVVSTLKSSITLARDYNEILSKSNTVFGESAKAIEEWADSAATSFGQSKAEALDAASSFGNMFSQLGLSSEAAADMSIQMTELASDFASFHNADITSVIEAQSAAFRGEYDSLQKFLPLINAATVEQKALAMTGKETTKELTAQDKALAVHALMLEGAGDAAGDFERTQGSLSNQQRILSAQWKDIQTDIGQALIPALTKIAIVVNTEVIPAVKKFAEDAKRYYNTDIKPVIEDLKKAWESVDQIVVPILELIGREIARMAERIRIAVGIVAALLSGDFKGAWEGAKELVGSVLESIKDVIDTFGRDVGPKLLEIGKAAIQKLLDGLYEMVNTWVIPFFTNLPGRVIDAIGDIGSKLYELGRQAIQKFIDGLKSIPVPNPVDWIGDAAGGLGGAVKGVFEQTRGASSGAVVRTGQGPTGAYGIALVRDPETGNYVYPWDVGGGLGMPPDYTDNEAHYADSGGRWAAPGTGITSRVPRGYRSKDVVDIRSRTAASAWAAAQNIQKMFEINIQNYNAGSADGDLASGDLMYALGRAGLA